MTNTQTFETNLQQLRERGVQSRFLARKNLGSKKVQKFLKQEFFTVVCHTCGSLHKFKGHDFRNKMKNGQNAFFCSKECTKFRKSNSQVKQQALSMDVDRRLIFMADYLINRGIAITN